MSLQDIIKVQDEFYILATSFLTDAVTRVLKSGETFAVFDSRGDVQPIGLRDQGIYHEGTRFLSRYVMRIWQKRPLLLNSAIHKNNALLIVDLTNPDIYREQDLLIPRGTLHIFRSKFLWDGSCYERLRIINYGSKELEVVLSFEYDSDFHDIFEVRGIKREHRGIRQETTFFQHGSLLHYQGLDGICRSTRFICLPEPKSISSSNIYIEKKLSPRQEESIYLIVSCEIGSETASVTQRISSPEKCANEHNPYVEAFNALTYAYQQHQERRCVIHSSNEFFNEWLNRSAADLWMMVTPTAHGIYPYAGVPWFSTIFGRDGIIAALETLWYEPDIARGVLSYLAATQAKEIDHDRDAEPGKILHETRQGEMAQLREIPFDLYYGSVDATPLFIMLADVYGETSGDFQFIQNIWPNIELALNWIQYYGDIDGDGFVEYFKHSQHGLLHQGWKDSLNSIFHSDGTPAEGPIALCEVQGYCYAAFRSAARLASRLGKFNLAEEYQQKAYLLRERFNRTFWCEEISTFGLALDGKKNLCRVRSSNAGHCLATQIAEPPLARRTASTLLAPESFSGWGIRTIAKSEANYNPMSYHNGTVWPHDNALIAEGFVRYGLKDYAIQILTGMFDTSLFMELHRLPELFCGFSRLSGIGPTLYPVACSPQAWATGAVFMLLKSCLGLSIHGDRAQVRFTAPALPSFIHEIHFTRLRVGASSVDISLRRQLDDITIQVLRRDGPVEVVVVK